MRKPIISFLLYQIPAFLFAITIFIISSIPEPPDLNMNIGFGDKISHLLAYTFLGILIARALFFQNKFPFFKQNYLWLTIFIGILYGISDEFHQSFVPGRTVEFADALADSIGIILGVNIFSYRERLIIFWKKLFTKHAINE